MTLRGSRHRPLSEPASDEVVITCVSAGLNYLDALTAGGLLPPGVGVGTDGVGTGGRLGGECAGACDVGRVRSHCLQGRRPCVRHRLAIAGLARRHPVPAGLVGLMPDGMSFACAATLPMAFLTVHYSLGHLAQRLRTKVMLVHSASGGVGLAALQFAQAHEITVIATAGTASKRDLPRLLGVEHVLDSRGLDFAEEVMRIAGGCGVDVVLTPSPAKRCREAWSCSVQAAASSSSENETSIPTVGCRSACCATLHPFRGRRAGDAQSTRRTGAVGVLRSRRTNLDRRLPRSSAPCLSCLTSHRSVPTHVALEACRQGRRVARRSTHGGKEAPSHCPARRFDLFGHRWARRLRWGHRHVVGRTRGWPPRPGQPARGCGSGSGRDSGRPPRSWDRGDRVSSRCGRHHGHASGPCCHRGHGPLPQGRVPRRDALDDGPLREVSDERFESVLRPKMLGGLVLDSLTRRLDLDHFVAFSSATCVIGNSIRRATWPATSRWRP